MLLRHRTVFDHWRPLALGIYVALAGHDGVFIKCGTASTAAIPVCICMYRVLKKTKPALADRS